MFCSRAFCVELNEPFFPRVPRTGLVRDGFPAENHHAMICSTGRRKLV
jgi:hypothetical protein